MGDVLLTTPAIRAVRSAFPQATIHFLSGPLGAAALAGNPHLDEVLPWRAGWREEGQLGRELRAAAYDAVVDFHSTPRTARLTAATRAQLRVGIVGRGPRNLLYTHRLPREVGPVYMARQKLRLLAPLGIDPEGVTDLSLEVALGEAEHEWAARVWEEQDLAGEAPVVAISPVSRFPFKQWGAANWAAVADALAERGARVLITSGPGERNQARAVVDLMTATAVWDYGASTVRGAAALYARCALWIGNDGGPKHLAAAVGIPTLTVIRWQLGPVWSDAADRRQLFLDPPPPQGCDRNCARCAHFSCLGAVTVEEVVETALARLQPRQLEVGRGG